jgi:hypothetical protein
MEVQHSRDRLGKGSCKWLLQLRDQFLQGWLEQLGSPGTNKLRTYKLFKSEFDMEHCLKHVKIVKNRVALPRLRVSCHCLAIETAHFPSPSQWKGLCSVLWYCGRLNTLFMRMQMQWGNRRHLPKCNKSLPKFSPPIPVRENCLPPDAAKPWTTEWARRVCMQIVIRHIATLAFNVYKLLYMASSPSGGWISGMPTIVRGRTTLPWTRRSRVSTSKSPGVMLGLGLGTTYPIRLTVASVNALAKQQTSKSITGKISLRRRW